MGTKTIWLSFTSPVHLGRGRLSDSGFSCDAATVFSALYIEALHAGMQNALLEAAREGALVLSDAFPYIGETAYLPRPMANQEIVHARGRDRNESRDSRERKAFKKLPYIPAGLYAEYLAGAFDAVRELGRFDLGRGTLQTKVNLTRSEGDDARPYFVGGYSFRPDAGLYFIVQGEYDVAPLVELLSYAGLGGKRSSGYGRFTFRVEDIDPRSQINCDLSRIGTSVLMTTSAPRPDELNDKLLEGARYQLMRRGGFVQSTTHSATPQKKRDMYLFVAGSTFRSTYEGDVFDVNATPGAHPVYRYAKALWMEV